MFTVEASRHAVGTIADALEKKERAALFFKGE
jgi:hypothetical protein